MENMVQGLLATVIGFSIVMLVLYLLSVILELLRFLSVKPAASPIEETIPEKAEQNEESDLETVAVITAALAEYLNTQPDGLVVRSIRKVPPWNGAARREQQKRFY